MNLLDKLKFFPFVYGVVKSADEHCKNDFSIDWQLPVIVGGIGIKSYEGATYKRGIIGSNLNNVEHLNYIRVR